MTAARGFSLIEILVAVAIVALMAAAVTISAGGAGAARVAERETQRLRQLLEHACERASLTGRPLGLHVAGIRYGFSDWDGEHFQVIQRDELRLRDLPSGMELRLGGPGAPAIQAEKFGEKPQIVCWPSGDLTPFELDVGVHAQPPLYRLTGAVDGSLAITQPGGP